MAKVSDELREAAQESFRRAAQEDTLQSLSSELFQFARVIAVEPRLRMALADPTVTVEPKQAAVRQLLEGKADEGTIELVERVVEEDLSGWALRRILEELAIQSALALADADGTLGEVEDELFRFARIVESEDSLRSALTSPVAPGKEKAQLVEDLLQGKASPHTVALLRFLAESNRPGDPVAAVDELAELAAARRRHVVVEARTALPLDVHRRARLAEALSRAAGNPVDLEVVVDPEVLGGVVARIGDEVIDGTVKRRLEVALEGLTR